MFDTHPRICFVVSHTLGYFVGAIVGECLEGTVDKSRPVQLKLQLCGAVATIICLRQRGSCIKDFIVSSGAWAA